MIDGVGVYGFVLHYALLFAFFGSALIIFIYLWRKKRLDMDEEPKYSMFDKEDEWVVFKKGHNTEDGELK